MGERVLIPFIDAHVHFWDLERLDYPWLAGPFQSNGPNGSVEAIASNYLQSDYANDLARWNVVGVVHIDAGAHASRALDETIWLEAQAGASGMPSGIVGFADLADPAVDVLLAAHSRHAHVRGIRQIVNWHDEPRYSYTSADMTLDPAWEAGYAKLRDYDLSFDLQCYPAQMQHIAAICARHPDIPVIINHMGMPLLNEPAGLDRWHSGMRALASLPHVSIKISGMGFVSREWRPELFRSLIGDTIDLFGIDRVMFASDAPTDKLFGPIDRYLNFYHQTVAHFSIADRHAVFARNANRIYRLELDDALNRALGEAP